MTGCLSTFQVLSFESLCAAVDRLHIGLSIFHSFEIADGSRHFDIDLSLIIHDSPVPMVVPSQKTPISVSHNFVYQFFRQH